MTRSLEFENEVERLVASVLVTCSDQLEDAGLTIRTDIEGWPEEDSDSSELRIRFFRGNDLVDFLETFVYRDGRQAATIEEFKEWLEQYIPVVLSEDAEERASGRE